MPSKSKIAYLTIDDSPTSSFTQKVDYLLERNIPAIFFCIGNLIEKRKEEVIDAIRKGFVIANHSYTHPHFSDITLAQSQEEIERTHVLINELYQAAGVERKYYWFRFPYGDKGDKLNGHVFPSKYGWVGDMFRKQDRHRKTSIQEQLQKLGYTQPTFSEINYRYMQDAGLFKDIDWHWTFDIMEWATFEGKPTQGLDSLEKLIRRMDEAAPKDARGHIMDEQRWLRSNNPEIILLHDHEETTEMFFPIIDRLMELPLNFKGIDG